MYDHNLCAIVKNDIDWLTLAVIMLSRNLRPRLRRTSLRTAGPPNGLCFYPLRWRKA